MRIALLLAVLSGLLSAQYQHYPKFYTSPSQTWATDKFDTTNYLIGTLNDRIYYNFMLTGRDDSLRNSSYLFINDRLHQKKFTFTYRGNLDSTFYLADQHNKGLLWLYTTTPQPFIVTDTGRFWRKYTKPEIISYLKKGSRYENRYNLANGDVIEMNIWFLMDNEVCYGELIFSSKEFVRKEGE
ncbi:MAG: hypothetical protein J0L60_06625 [Ignavibacteria bacterium]|nr:hypothetical protein [Ignavibacteria bacterium]